MNIYHFITSIDRSNGGPSESVTSLIQGQIQYANLSVKLITFKSDNPVIQKFLNAEKAVDFFENRFFGWIPNVKIINNRFTAGVLHVHGIWEWSAHQMVKKARKTNLRYVLSPRGMLEPWALSQGRWKKRIAMKLYQRLDLEKADCLHATSEMEAISMRQLGLKNPIAVIPNSIEITSLEWPLDKFNKPNNKVLFLSRIHPKKGIENLIAAWKNIPNSYRVDWTLEIIGNGESDYINKLKNSVIENNLEQSVRILDPVFDERKKEVYQSADIFVLPTFSENFGMVVAEAMSYGIPVITTKGAPWKELKTQNAGWWIDIGVEPLTHALIDAISTPKEKLIEMGLNGRKLVEDKYSIETVAKQMSELYYWILKQGPKPDFIFD
jgi:glycosyltransferase involved in cell wall biosynthesis